METIPRKVVWNITYNRHAKSLLDNTAPDSPAPGELTHDKALTVCDDLVHTGISSVTLSGGEPLLREDWHIIAEKLVKGGIKTSLVTDGWLINADIAKQIKSCGISRVIIHLDGLEKTHDKIWKKGMYRKVLSTCTLLRKRTLSPVIRTTVTTQSIKELTGLKKILYKYHISSWQFRAALPGKDTRGQNDKKYTKLVLSPEQMSQLINFCYETMKENSLTIEIADEIGYFSVKDMEIRKKSPAQDCFFTFQQGCPAGKSECAILPTGDVTPCTLISDNSNDEKSTIAGNLKNNSLLEIWKRKDTFYTLRRLNTNDLKGFCRICQYNAYCLGGCSGAKLAFSGSLYENTACIFSLSMTKERKKVDKIKDIPLLISTGRALINQKAYQIAEFYLQKAYTLNPLNLEILDLLGFVHFFLENYTLCKEFNEKALAIKPNHAYAHKGLGLALAKLGNLEKGIQLLYKAIDLADTSYTDPYYDLAVILSENDRIAEALHILGIGRNVSSQFRKSTDSFYRSLVMKLKNN